MNRKVELQITEDQLADIADTIISWPKVWEAIGYLSTWSADNYPTVRIYRDGNGPDMAAVYLKGDGELGYVIGAVWHDDHYGFHS